MKNTVKRLISTMLCIALLTCLCGTFALADTQYRHFDSVFAIGDSNTSGYGLPHYSDFAAKPYLHLLEGSYPYLVAEELGIPYENRNSMNYPALRCVDAYNFLGGDIDLSNDPYYTNAVFRHNWIDIMEADSGPNGMNFINRISKKDGERELVLLNAGGADIFYCTAKMSFSNSGFSPSNTDELESFIQNLISNYNKFLKYFPALIERIKELNDTATIAIIGTFNPLKDLKLTADSLLPVGNLAAVITNDMNRHYRQWAKQYGCMYVDISNVDTLTLESDITLDMFSSIDPLIVYHASPDGYKYIARQILRQLEEGSSIRRDISIDLGSAGDVTKVSFGGLPILKFSFDPETRELILPYSLRLPGLIKVTETRGGNSYDIIYGMSWLSGAYAANRIFASKNIGSLFTDKMLSLLDYSAGFFTGRLSC